MMRLINFFLSAAFIVASLAVGFAQAPSAPQAPQAPAAQNATPQQLPDPTPPESLPRPSTTDPRANLKPGAVGQKAAEAAWNMELVANLPPPEGFFNKEQPLGWRPPTPDP